MRKLRWLFLAALVAAGGAASWFFWSPPDAAATGDMVAAAPAPAAPPPKLEPYAPPPSLPDGGTLSTFDAVVVDTKGDPVAGAEVTLFEGIGERAPELKCIGHARGFFMNNMASCSCGESAKQVEAFVASAKEPRALATAVSGADGRVEIPVLDRMDVALVHARKGELEAIADRRAERLVLKPLKQLEGRVTLPGDRPYEQLVRRRGEKGADPVPGARIIVVGSTLQRVESAADGRFTVRVPDGPVAIIAAKRGLLPGVVFAGVMDHRAWAMAAFGHSAVDGPTVELAPPITLKGRVTLEGRGVGGVTVRQQMVPCAAEAVTSADGSFTLPYMRAQDYAFHAEKDALSVDRNVKAGEPIELELERQAVVEGDVLDAEGQPVSGADVDARFEGHLRGGARTNAAGHFRMNPIPPGHLTLRAQAEGFRREEQPLDLQHPGAHVTLTLRPGVLLHGHTIDETGAAVPYATVEARPPSGSEEHTRGQPLAWVRTGRGGAFEMTTLDEGEVRLDARAPGYLPGSAKVKAPGDAALVTLTRQAVIRGTLRGASGTAVSRWAVSARLRVDATGARLPESVSKTYGGMVEADGAYRIEGLPAGTYEVTGSVSQRTATGATTTAVAAGGTATVDIEIKGGGAISGVVRDAAGRALAGAEVSASKWAGSSPAAVARAEQLNMILALRSRGRAPVTDAEGRFRLDDVAAGEWAVTATLLGYTQKTPAGPVDPGATDVVVTLERSGVVTGRVVGPKGPVETFSVNGESFRSSDGRFEVDRRVTHGSIELKVVADGLVPLERKLEPGTGDVVDVGDVRLEKGRAVTGRVMGASAPLDGASVSCSVGDSHRSCGMQQTKADGTFSLEGLTDEQVTLDLRRNGWRSARVTVEPGTRSVEVRLVKGITVKGRLLDQKGEPMFGFRLSPGGAAARDVFFADIREDGTFEVGGLSPGDLTLTPSPNDEMSRAWAPVMKLAVKERDALELDIHGRTDGVRVTVLLPGPNCRVNKLEISDGTVREDPYGMMMLPAVPPGRHVLTWRDEDGKPHQRTVDVGAQDMTVQVDAEP